MKRDNFDKLAQAADLIKGVVDTMVCMEDARQDRLIPITVLCSFEAVLEKALLRLQEIEMTECGQEGGSIRGVEAVKGAGHQRVQTGNRSE